MEAVLEEVVIVVSVALVDVSVKLLVVTVVASVENGNYQWSDLPSGRSLIADP